MNEMTMEQMIMEAEAYQKCVRVYISSFSFCGRITKSLSDGIVLLDENGIEIIISDKAIQAISIIDKGSVMESDSKNALAFII